MPTDEWVLPEGTRSSACFFDKPIRQGLERGLTAQRIYQDLVTEYQAEVSYDAIKRYVRKLRLILGRVPPLKDGVYRKPWLFKLVLSCSRHSWEQDVETFIRCHQRAFEALGGVPRIIKLDNLKSGVLTVIPGKFRTRNHHFPPNKTFTTENRPADIG